jgi:hypothetical protein
VWSANDAVNAKHTNLLLCSTKTKKFRMGLGMFVRIATPRWLRLSKGKSTASKMVLSKNGAGVAKDGLRWIVLLRIGQNRTAFKNGAKNVDQSIIKK